VTVDDCISEFSDEASIVITGLTKENRISFYPNPANAYLIISDLSTPDSQVMVTDMIGRSLNMSLEKLEGNNFRLSVSQLEKGIYLLRIAEDQKLHQIKFVKN
jgi:hypothetical protein